MIQVTNRSKDPVEGRYGGDDYRFEPGKSVVVSEGVVEHLFGYWIENKADAFRRIGWVTQSSDNSFGLEKLKEFSFDEVVSSYTVANGVPSSVAGVVRGPMATSAPEPLFDQTEE